MAKIVQVKIGDKKYWAYRRFNWKGFKFEYLDVNADDGWNDTWWDSGTVYFRDCLCENKDDLEIALGLKERKPVEEEPDSNISEPTQSILKAIEQRPDDFLFSKATYHGCYVHEQYVIDRKTKLKLIRTSGVYSAIYRNNKNITFIDDEYKMIEKSLQALYDNRKDLQNIANRYKLTQKFKEYENV